jgi:CheY-like chemotaxis protein
MKFASRKPNFDEARALYTALMEVFVSNPGGKNDPQTIARITSLCDATVRAVDDLECRVAIRGVQAYATLLYTDDGYEGVQSGSLRGTDALRFQALNALSAFRGQLNILETRLPSVPELPALEAKKNRRVLVVEDNRDSADSLRKLLELCGYKVTVAYTAEEGLAAVRRTRPDVVLCDIGLPDTDGFTLAREIHKDPEMASVRLIAVTAYGNERDRARSRECGFELHLVKPVDPQVLLHELDAGTTH